MFWLAVKLASSLGHVHTRVRCLAKTCHEYLTSLTAGTGVARPRTVTAVAANSILTLSIGTRIYCQAALVNVCKQLGHVRPCTDMEESADRGNVWDGRSY